MKMRVDKENMPGVLGNCISGYLSIPDNMDAKAVITEVLGVIDQQQDPVVLLSNESNAEMDGFAVFLNEKAGLSLNMVTGRSFNKADFETDRNTAIISERLIRQADTDEFNYSGSNMDVLGVYKEIDVNGYLLPDFFIPYNAKCFSERRNSDIIICTPSYPAELMKKVKKYIEARYDGVTIDFSDSDIGRYFMHANYPKDIAIELFLLLILIAINSCAVCENWLISRKKELSIRYICGATHRDNSQYIISLFAEMMILGYIGGISLAAALFCIVKFTFFADTFLHLYGTQFNYKIVTTATIAYMMLGTMLFAFSYKVTMVKKTNI